MAGTSPTPGKAKGEPAKTEKPVSLPPLSLPQILQHAASSGGAGEARINVRLLIDGSDADGVRHYDEDMSVSLVRAILSPEVADFFVPIKGTGRLKPGRVKSHWLHTGYIREVLLLDELPEEEGQ